MSNNDDDLTDITNLPDLGDEEMDDDFLSLDDMADNSEEDESPPDFNLISESPESDNQFDNDLNEDMDFNSNEESEDFLSEDEEEFTPDDTQSFSDDTSEHNEPFSASEDFPEAENNNEELLQNSEEDLTKIGIPEAIDNEDQELDSPIPSELIANEEGEAETPKLISEQELTPQAREEVDSPIEKTQINAVKENSSGPKVEFEKFQSFAKEINFSDFSSEATPPFTIILKNIKYLEDANQIIDILTEYKIIQSEEHIEEAKSIISRGMFIIPRLSEYAAIFLCHKIRQYDVDISMGLTQEIDPPKSYQSNDKGLITKESTYARKKHHYNFNKVNDSGEILTTTLDKLSDHQIVKYYGIITEAIHFDSDFFQKETRLEEQMLNTIPQDSREYIDIQRIKNENSAASQSSNQFDLKEFYSNDSTPNTNNKSLDEVYEDLIKKVKSKAKKSSANAIVGINFSINPIFADQLKQMAQYQVLCTGNLVWVEKE